MAYSSFSSFSRTGHPIEKKVIKSTAGFPSNRTRRAGELARKGGAGLQGPSRPFKALQGPMPAAPGTKDSGVGSRLRRKSKSDHKAGECDDPSDGRHRGNHEGRELACHAPSLHNSQPWRWLADSTAVDLFLDPHRLVTSADSSGREAVISCGALLDHFQVAMAPPVGTRLSTFFQPQRSGPPGLDRLRPDGLCHPTRRDRPTRYCVAEPTGVHSGRQANGRHWNPCCAAPSKTTGSSSRYWPTRRGPDSPRRPGSPRPCAATTTHTIMN
ncbi:putative nAD(P)H nitroreductase acg [Mycobacterium kansasii]|uniref:Putative nAD(P)H nitroreductase acg n=1 Tax=Mycobacterium kansasii TaxID=1768 RepID=A0A1V3W8S1_MYCKA|nr:putative nAD(P)H nitroreductase acg [Mycobacterium kansasii]